MSFIDKLFFFADKTTLDGKMNVSSIDLNWFKFDVYENIHVFR